MPASTYKRTRQKNVLPGFGLTMGLTLAWLGLIVIFPLIVLVARSSEIGLVGLVNLGLQPRVLAALKTSFGLAFLAACINAVFGLMLAWVLSRYDFPFKRLVDAAVDLPFALPTAVAGIALAAIYAPNGWVGKFFGQYGIKIAFAPQGIVIALVFIGLPFIVRTLQPVMAELEKEQEEAAATLGATRLQTLGRIIMPTLAPALLTGFALAFARGIGEYGSVIFIAGNIPFISEIAPLLIIIKLEEYNYEGATAIATLMLLVSMILLLLINAGQSWSRRRLGHA